jgi:hypothetical protein
MRPTAANLETRMPNPPQLDNNHPPAFPQKLHKKKKDPQTGQDNVDTGTFWGTGITQGDKVTVKGTHGSSPTVWQGSIGQQKGDGSWPSNDIKVQSEQVGIGPRTGSEDVTVTVTNSMTGPSNMVTSPSVSTIP